MRTGGLACWRFSLSQPRLPLRYWLVMPIADLQQGAQKIAGFLSILNKLGGLRLKYRITAGDGARDPEGIESRVIYIELAGPDVPLVTQHNGELLRALETIAAQILRLDQREHDLVSFDAGNFKALRAAELRLAAETAAEKVLRSGSPYAFPPMNSRERRLLHLAFKSLEGVETASSGEGQDRFLAVFPAGKTNLPVAAPMKPRGFGRR
jgi:spoIIIJ-associated protein